MPQIDTPLIRPQTESEVSGETLAGMHNTYCGESFIAKSQDDRVESEAVWSG